MVELRRLKAEENNYNLRNLQGTQWRKNGKVRNLGTERVMYG